ncbi:MAG: hypothetical protein WC133_05690 [Candidatus Omnitrophota bacterium]
MKRSFVFMLAVAMLFSMSAGCSRVQKIVVTQGEISEPSEPMGSIEVQRKAPRIPYRRIFGQLWEWVTFGHCENISREAYLQGLLNKKMLKDAKNDYNAEAVIHVKYWPDLTAKKFPQGLIYAKGDMVRHKRFPA